MDHFNRASTGACQAVTEFGDVFYLKTRCKKNGAQVQRYDNADCSGDPVEDDLVPWNYCYKGVIKLGYKSVPQELIPIGNEEASSD